MLIMLIEIFRVNERALEAICEIQSQKYTREIIFLVTCPLAFFFSLFVPVLLHRLISGYSRIDRLMQIARRFRWLRIRTDAYSTSCQLSNA